MANIVLQNKPNSNNTKIPLILYVQMKKTYFLMLLLRCYIDLIVGLKCLVIETLQKIALKYLVRCRQKAVKVTVALRAVINYPVF